MAAVSATLTRHAPGIEGKSDGYGTRERKGAALLMEPVLGADRTEGLIQRVNAVEALNDVRELRRFLAREGH